VISIENDPLLAEIVRRLVEAYQPERIYLFGSKARGDAGPDSDYDLMVVVPDSAPPERRRRLLPATEVAGYDQRSRPEGGWKTAEDRSQPASADFAEWQPAA
jgi:predicted nucleotidyltransferase